MELRSFKYNQKDFKGRNRRLLLEWQKIESRFTDNPDIEVVSDMENSVGIPVSYRVRYKILSICDVENKENMGVPGVSNPPLFDCNFTLTVTIPENFPDIDGSPVFRFENVSPEGIPQRTPWHPNIRFFGPMKGLVCLNRTDTFGDIADGIGRIADYLKYNRYHAELTPPFPEDLKVADWIRKQAEPNGWLNFKDWKNHDFYER